ncbi:MAG: helix-turn-helix domain-containing protein, partial [Thermomicrobiales bacterium]|nr:helix-turn-helix domain-containing protein [Thermomicrobiales bacterium]
MDNVLTAHQVAARLGVSPRTVRNLAARHDIGSLVTGRLRLYTEADVE